MSRIKELKEKYPQLNISFFDIMTRIDISKSNKYLPLICKLFSKRFDVNQQYGVELENGVKDLKSRLINCGVDIDGLTPDQLHVMVHFLDYFNHDNLNSISQFMDYMEKGLIENKDVLTYNDLDSIKGAITLASMREWTKDLEGEVIKEYEDDKWVIVRPLTFAASAKYGAATRWCTTYIKEKQYFEKYWRRGILVYFINKVSGYKFAGYKALDGDNELSFWNMEDSRIDYLYVDADDYLFPIVRNIFKSQDTNKNLCSSEIQEQVHKECIEQYEELKVLEAAPAYVEAVEPTPSIDGLIRRLRAIHTDETIPPVYEPPNIA